MSIFSIPNIRISGISACVPKNKISTLDYEWIPLKEREQFVKTIGVETKRLASGNITTSDLCFTAAEKLISDLNWDKKDISALVFVSQSRDYIIPSTSGILQDRLGLSQSTSAFDINMGCSGYIYGLSSIASLMNFSKGTKALLLVGDVSSSNTSYKDKSSYPLFGDAGTATALEFDQNAKNIEINTQSDGSGWDAIVIPDGGMRNPVSIDSFKYKKYPGDLYRNNLQVALNGIEVFNFSLREVVPNIKKLLKENNRKIEDFDYLVLHQANKLINKTIVKMLKFDKTKVPETLSKFGNTSSASIPLTIVSELREDIKEKKLKLLLSAFGIGLSWGTIFIETNKIVCPEIIEI